MPLVAPLFAGPLDIVGDIHGEIDALRDLLVQLGYDGHGRHAAGRRLAFVGDLCDRGPDSPAVIEFVAALVDAGLAQCVLGNHELNLLRGARKDGNGWFFADSHDARKHRYLDSRALPEADRAGVERFLLRLPLALESPDLRLVHAAWHAASIDLVRHSAASAVALYEEFSASTQRQALESGLAGRAKAEEARYAAELGKRECQVPLLPAIGALEQLNQLGNPIRIITSGLESVAQQPFFASEKWRMVNRVAWWNEYRDSTPVIFGHYWRWPTDAMRSALSKGEPDIFAPAQAPDFLGPLRNAYCVDFAVGARYQERAQGATDTFQCRLAAVRWPERDVVFDDGTRQRLG